MKVDNFTLEQFACGRKGEYRIERGHVPRDISSALNLGVMEHHGLAEWYRKHSPLHAMMAIKSNWPESFIPDDHRTLERALKVMELYIREYPGEPFKVVGYPEAPMVEIPFVLPLGLQLASGEEIEYGGIIDLIVERNGELFIVDHKTTSQLGAQYFYQYKPNNQLSGYCWAATQLSGKPVAGALVNALGILKTDTKFERQWITRSVDDIEEWKLDVQAQCNMIDTWRRTGYFPKHTLQCITKYGACMYHQVCSLSSIAKVRDRFLDQEYRIDKWDFEKRDAVG